MKKTLLIAGLLFVVGWLGIFLTSRRAPAAREAKSGSGSNATASVATPSTSNPGLPPQTVTAVAGGTERPKSLLDMLAEVSDDPIIRQAELDKIASDIPEAELERTLESIWESELPAADDLSHAILRRWSQRLPGVAASWLAQKEESDRRASGSMAVATVWAEQNPERAAEWVRQWPAKNDEGMIAVAYQVARASPREALALAIELPASSARDELIEHAVRSWAGQDSEAPVKWAAEMESSPLRDAIVAGASLALSETDPVKAAELALRNISAGKAQNDAVVGIVQRWTQSEPEAAAQWVSSFPEGPLRESAAENLILIWSEKSASDVGEWLNDLAPGPSRDAAVATYSGKLADSAPDTAAVWIDSIEEPVRRKQEMENLAQRWLLMDSSKAKEWIERAGFDAEEKAKLYSTVVP